MRAVGYGMVTAGSILWGLNGPVSRMVLDAGIGPTQLAGWRVLSAAILITGVLILLRRVRFRCSRRALLSMAAFGVFGVSMPQWLYYEAISRFDVGLTLVIVYTAPLWVAGIHRVTRGTRQPRQVSAAMGLAMVGVAIAVLGGGGLGQRLGARARAGHRHLARLHDAADPDGPPRRLAAGQLAARALDDLRRRVLAAAARRPRHPDRAAAERRAASARWTSRCR